MEIVGVEKNKFYKENRDIKGDLQYYFRWIVYAKAENDEKAEMTVNGVKVYQVLVGNLCKVREFIMDKDNGKKINKNLNSRMSRLWII